MMELVLIVTIFSAVYAFSKFIPDLYEAIRSRAKFTSNEDSAKELSRFFIQLKPNQIIQLGIAASVVVGLLTKSFIFFVALLMGSLIAPKLVISIVKARRSKAFDASLIDALLLLNNSLRSGLDMASGIERIANTMKPPVSEEFGLVLNAYRLGTPLEDALMDMTKRIESKILETVVSAIAIQRETGGNIIKTFDQLIITIREEDKLQRKVQAMTSQGKTQIFFLAGFPWGLAALFAMISPDMFVPALSSSYGQITIVVLIVWEIIGISITKKIVLVDI